jgi:hypothetical protein
VWHRRKPAEEFHELVGDPLSLFPFVSPGPL